MFDYKIVTAEKLADFLNLLKERPKIVLCHGCFDLVHPGHIRHLTYAKSLGDVLVASLTTDEFINKGSFRPYVPEQMRARNLAALEMVDYVVIDPHPTPLEMIRQIKPQVYAKGFEYAELSEKTKTEKGLVESYGGQMVFTPGDIVYSSTAIIQQSRPNLAREKLLLLMEAEKIHFSDLYEAIDRIGTLRCHIVGDIIVDTYTYAVPTGSIGKTPTISARFEHQDRYIGGAGIVAKHAHGAGALTLLTSIIGDDELGAWVKQEFGSHNWLIDPSRPTIEKHTFVAGDYRVFKLDTLDNRPISKELRNQIETGIHNAPTDVLILSDFRHGIFDKVFARELIMAGKSHYQFIAADSQVASRWGNILDFKGADLIMANEKEARFALGDQDSTIRPLGRKLYSKACAETVILKLGEEGAITFRRPPEGDLEDARAWFVIDSFARKVVDPVGAGDAFLAYSALSIRATGNAYMATILGSIAAALECEVDGNHPITAHAVKQRLKEFEI